MNSSWTLQGCTLVVSWLPGNCPQHSKGGEAHQNAALTMPTNRCGIITNKRLLSFGSCLGTQSSKEPVESRSTSIERHASDRRSATDTTISVATPTLHANMSGVLRIVGMVLIFHCAMVKNLHPEILDTPLVSQLSH